MRDEIVAGQVRSRETKGRRECRLLDLRGPRKKSRPLGRTRVVRPIGRILFTRLPIEANGQSCYPIGLGRPELVCQTTTLAFVGVPR